MLVLANIFAFFMYIFGWQHLFKFVKNLVKYSYETYPNYGYNFIHPEFEYKQAMRGAPSIYHAPYGGGYRGRKGGRYGGRYGGGYAGNY